MDPSGDHLVELEILGRTYQVGVTGSHEWAQKVGDLVDQTMRRIQKETRLTDVTKIAILTALNISDRLLRMEDSRTADAERISQASQQVVDVLEEALR